eukprot:NODE_3830_length_1978_cov_2.633712.p1 GENE.NODE_3830_length_1978_cov_2.633712~~NODE_3830_length_1978_cov_2.633712.p1  ORF type:complete len:394 (+),score=84.22 NODE_3830_length_1978_cov_2.633712:526-1707(+)
MARQRGGVPVAASYALFPSLALIEFSAAAFTFSTIGFVWHFPNHMAVITALAQVGFGSVVMLAMRWLQPWFGLTAVWVGNALISFAFVSVIIAAAPSQDEYFAESRRVLGFEVLQSRRRSFVASVRLGYGIMAHSSRDFLIFFLTSLPLFANIQVLTASNQATVDALFGGSHAAAHRLANFQAVAGIVSVALTPAVALSMDKISVKYCLLLALPVLVVSIATFPVASWPLAFICRCCNMTMSHLATAISYRIILCYALPNAFGAVVLCIAIAAAVTVLPATLALQALAGSGPHAVSVIFWEGIAAAAALLLCGVRLACIGIPAVPHMTPEDEAAFVAPFGAVSLDELVAISGKTCVAELLDIFKRGDIAQLQQLHECAQAAVPGVHNNINGSG